MFPRESSRLGQPPPYPVFLNKTLLGITILLMRRVIHITFQHPNIHITFQNPHPPECQLTFIMSQGSLLILRTSSQLTQLLRTCSETILLGMFLKDQASSFLVSFTYFKKMYVTVGELEAFR